jgi:hypothetical protein
MRKPSRLLSVAIVLGAAHASAEPADLVEATAEVRMREYYERYAVEQFLTRPRRLPTGAPACGNVNSKSMPVPCTLAYADELAAIRHAEMLATVALAHAARVREAAARVRGS